MEGPISLKIIALIGGFSLISRSSGDIAVVFDVAGTMLRMYRVAKEISSGRLLERVVTSDLIMEKAGRALIVPQADPRKVMDCPPDFPIGAIISDREDSLQVSCSSTPVTREEALQVLRSSSATMADIQDVSRAARSRCPGGYQTTGMIIDADLGVVSYAISTSGKPFPGLQDVLNEMGRLGIEVFVASGDSMGSLDWLTRLGLRRDHIYPISTPARKAEVVRELKESFKKVIMIGDGLNDLLALQAADVGVLTVQQDSHPPKSLLLAADRVIVDIAELPGLVEVV
jgi:soluble P-type ATPase